MDAMDILLQSNMRDFYKTGWMTGDGLDISMDTDIGLLDLDSSKNQDRHVAFWNECGRRSRPRKKRPRSSPVRSRQKIRLRLRSPSIKPVDALRSAAARLPIAKDFNEDFTKKRIYAFGNGVESFFSPQPPNEPMRIVFFNPTQKLDQLINKSVRDSPPQTETVNSDHQTEQLSLWSLPQKTRKNNQLSLSRTQIEVQSLQNNDASAISPPVYLPHLTMPVQPAQPSALFASIRSCSKISENMVRHLLFKLVSNLPLRVSVTDAATTAISPLGLPRREPKHVRRRSGQSCCSTAVQVAAHAKSTSEVSYATEQATSGNGEEWVGGVRALRDSHVRLVLHQLKHIDRLNRTLDHAFRPRSLCSKQPLHK